MEKIVRAHLLIVTRCAYIVLILLVLHSKCKKGFLNIDVLECGTRACTLLPIKATHCLRRTPFDGNIRVEHMPLAMC